MTTDRNTQIRSSMNSACQYQPGQQIYIGHKNQQTYGILMALRVSWEQATFPGPLQCPLATAHHQEPSSASFPWASPTTRFSAGFCRTRLIPCCGYEQLPPRIPPKLRQERGKKKTSCLGHRNSRPGAGKEGFRRALPARDVVVTPEHG
jgi:hypothetical protein